MEINKLEDSFIKIVANEKGEVTLNVAGDVGTLQHMFYSAVPKLSEILGMDCHFVSDDLEETEFNSVTIH